MYIESDNELSAPVYGVPDTNDIIDDDDDDVVLVSVVALSEVKVECVELQSVSDSVPFNFLLVPVRID